MEMERTRKSLYYPVAYLTLTGLAFLFFPQQFLKLAFSTGHYDSVFPQFVGAMMIALGIVAFGVVRERAVPLYKYTMWTRALVAVCVIVFYFETKDPFFLVPFVVVAVGLVATSISYIKDKKDLKSDL